MEIAWSKESMEDIKFIFEYLKETSAVSSARKFRKKIFDKAAFLKSFPRLGKQSQVKFFHQEIRFLIEGHYKIIYRLEEDLITILAVIDSRTNPQKDIYQ